MLVGGGGYVVGNLINFNQKHNILYLLNKGRVYIAVKPN